MSTHPASHDLSAYLDGELSPAERVRVEEALDADPSLQAELDSLRQVTAMLRRHGPVDAPFGFQARVLEAVKDEPLPSPSWWAWLRRPFGIPIEGVAVATAALLVALVVTTRTGPTPTVDQTAFEAPNAEGEQVLPSLGDEVERDAAAARLPMDTTQQAQAAVPPEEKGAGGSHDGDVPSAMRTQRVIAPSLATRGSEDAGLATEPTALAEGEALPVGSVETGTAEDEGRPALFGASYRYRVSAASPESLGQLLRLAGRYGGRVVDASGREITRASMLTEPRSVRVQIPARNLGSFGEALRSLGLVEETADDRIFASSQVSIQVDLIPE